MNEPTSQEILARLSDFIRSLTDDRELAAYMAGILRALYLMELSADDASLVLFMAVNHSTDPLDREKIPEADQALRRLLTGDTLAAFRNLFDQSRIH